MRNNLSKITLAAGVALALAFTFGCPSSENYNYDSDNASSSSRNAVSSNSSLPQIGPPVYYQGETYQTVVIGTQTWFKRNLNYAVEGSLCYDNDPSNCAIYGRLYDWATATQICPSGWHLPSDADWEKLMRYVKDETNAANDLCLNLGFSGGEHLKANTGWNSNGKDTYGFSALPGGCRALDGMFGAGGEYGYWWSSSEEKGYQNIFAYEWSIDECVYKFSCNKGCLFSVRCVQD